MPKTTAKAGKKGRKFGSNKVFCERYRAENRRLRNKIKKLKKHLKKLPEDVQAQEALERLS